MVLKVHKSALLYPRRYLVISGGIFDWLTLVKWCYWHLVGREARDAIKHLTVITLSFLKCTGKSQEQRIIQLQMSKLFSLRTCFRIFFHDWNAPEDRSIHLGSLTEMSDRNYHRPWDTGALEPKGVLGLDTNTVSGPLLHIVCYPNSLALGFSIN